MTLETKAEREARHQSDRGLNRRKLVRKDDGFTWVPFPTANRVDRKAARRGRKHIHGMPRRTRPDGTTFTTPPMAARKARRR